MKTKKPDLPVWVLNLKRDKQRLRFISRQLRALHMPFSVVEAVDGSRLTPEDLRVYSRARALEFSKRELTPGEIGCALSHARMWERMIRECIPEVLIFEDDVWIGSALPVILANRRRLPKDWELVNFSTDALQEPFGEFLSDIYRASRHKDWATRSSAYLLNARGADKLLRNVYPIGHTADGVMWRTDITGLISYGVYPRVVILSDLDSRIWTSGGIKKQGLLSRKTHEFVLMAKSISRFFGITALIKGVRSLFSKTPHS